MQEKKYAIKNWAVDDRPREKLLSKNPAALSDSELLAILINKGYRDKNAIELAREILALGRNDLNELGKLPVKKLMKIRGIGMAKAITVAAALELGRRRQSTLALVKPVVKASRDIATYLQPLLRDYPYEVFGVVFMNRANAVVHFEIISEGGITGTVADPRVILKKAIQEDAVGIILCHNHPSGSLQPSRNDIDLTVKIKEAANFLDIRVIDHIIITENGYFSFADHALI
jgi:DNA repair protein RadC